MYSTEFVARMTLGFNLNLGCFVTVEMVYERTFLLYESNGGFSG